MSTRLLLDRSGSAGVLASVLQHLLLILFGAVSFPKIGKKEQSDGNFVLAEQKKMVTQARISVV